MRSYLRSENGLIPLFLLVSLPTSNLCRIPPATPLRQVDRDIGITVLKPGDAITKDEAGCPIFFLYSCRISLKLKQRETDQPPNLAPDARYLLLPRASRNMAMPRRKSTPNASGTNSVRSGANRHHEAFLAIAKSASKTYGAVDKIHPLLVLNYTVWRAVGGTVSFALLLGFLHTWSFIEKNLVASTLEFIWRKGGAVVEVMLSNAYSASRVLRHGLLNATPAGREFLLRTPDWVKEKKPKFWQSLTWPGRASSIDSAWDNANRVAQTRMELSKQQNVHASGRAGEGSAGGSTTRGSPRRRQTRTLWVIAERLPMRQQSSKTSIDLSRPGLV
jgi:hypothetical protein